MPASDPPQDDDDLLAKVKAAEQADAEAAKPIRDMAELTEKLAKATELAARSQAELQNAKVRLEREAGDLRKFAAEAVLLKLLPTIDNFQRALKHLPKDLEKNEWVKGVVTIEQELLRQAAEMGLVRFESLGQPVDAERHEVLMAEGDANTVVEVLEDGYELHGKVVRPAKVKAGGG